MDEIITALRAHIDDEPVRFVFHSETAAAFWAQHALVCFGKKTLARDRFIAWETFKAENLSAALHNQRPVSQTIRILYACSLCAQNAAAPFLRTLIPVQYAKDGVLFAKSIARILPTLRLWQKKMNENSGGADEDGDSVFEDLTALEKHYRAFLEQNGLFEPSWEKPPFNDTAHTYFIFYPALIEDFAEYEELLQVDTVHKVELALKDEDDRQNLFLYDSSRTELHAILLEMRRLHTECAVAYEEMALSAAQLDVLEAYITRDLKLFNIPFNLRSGKPLAHYGAGLFFSLVSRCVQNDFSWESLQALLTNNALPWRCPNKNKALLSFGIKNNCVTSYRYRGARQDVWEESFSKVKNKERLFNHYKKLKAKLRLIAAAPSFSALLCRTQNFFVHFFKDTWNDKTSRILGRCLNELTELVILEKKIPALRPPPPAPSEGAAEAPVQPLSVFTLLLKEKTHVGEVAKQGVNVFNYGAAASIPCKVHFIMNANQSALTKLFHPLPYLRQESRKRLRLDDIDISKELIKSYRQVTGLDGGENDVRVSAAVNTLSGYEIPHTYFNSRSSGGGELYKAVIPATVTAPDYYRDEKNWWQSEPAALPSFPAALFPPQKKGFDAWYAFKPAASFNLLKEAFPPDSLAARLIRQKIMLSKYKDRGERAGDGRLRVSATSLNHFFTCPVYWLYALIFKMDRYPIFAGMIDNENKGILYHEVLSRLFQKIKDEDGFFYARNLDVYRVWAEELAVQTARSFKEIRGPLAASLMLIIARSIAQNINQLLEFEAKKYDGWGILALEESYREERDDLILTGKIDRLSVSPEYAVLIMDYKTGALPAKRDCFHNPPSVLRDFQMPFYIKLYEKAAGAPVEYALFFNAVRAEERSILKPEGRASIGRGDYQSTLDAVEHFVKRHKEALQALDFSPRAACDMGQGIDFSQKKLPFDRCPRCDYRTVCRSLYNERPLI